MNRLARTLVAVFASTALACGESSPTPTSDVEPADDMAPEVLGTLLVEAPVGAEGAVLEAPGVVLEIPGGALSETVPITISVLPQESDPEALTPVYVFGPEGLHFDVPVRVTLEAPGVEGFMQWSLPDGSGYELAGTIVDGIGIAGSDHFSKSKGGACPATKASHPCASGCKKQGKADGCYTTPDLLSSPNPEYRQWCACSEPATPFEKLCATDPKIYAPGPCPSRDPGHFPDADGQAMFAARDGDGCKGYAWRTQSVHLCHCRGTPQGQSEQSLCPIPWKADGSGNEICMTTLAWGDLPNQALPGPPAPDTVHPEYGMMDPKLSGEQRAKAWVEEGWPTRNCTGYWQYSPNDELVSGKVAACDEEPTELDRRWELVEGQAIGCEPIEWPKGVKPIALPEGDESRERGRLTRTEWLELRRQRYLCNVPTPGFPLVPGDQLPIEDRDVISRLQFGGQVFLGFNASAREARERAFIVDCERPVPYPAYRGIDEGAMDSGKHAEGDALKQLAAFRQRTVAATTPQNPQGFGADPVETSGCAEMLTDTAPCVQGCADHGIELGRRIAGLAFLISKAPDGCRCYGEDPDEVGRAWGQPTRLGLRGGRCIDMELTCADWHDRSSTATLCIKDPAAE